MTWGDVEAFFAVIVVGSFIAGFVDEFTDFYPDIAIIDEVLPLGNGKEVCSRLRERFGIPTILMGAGTGGEVWMRSVESGADFYLSKSFFNYQELVARVKAILRRYKGRKGGNK